MQEEKVYMSMYSRNAELYHHGIKGQKWGVQNGPPYPLDRELSKKEKKQKISSKDLSDEELANALRRLRMDAEYTRLTKELNSNPSAKSTVLKYVEKYGDKVVGIAITAVATAVTKKALHAIGLL